MRFIVDLQLSPALCEVVGVAPDEAFMLMRSALRETPTSGGKP